MGYDQAFMFNVAGASLLTAALVLHIVCLATPNFICANYDDFGKEIMKIATENPASLGLSLGLSAEEIKEQTMGMSESSINYGMWKLCMQQGNVDLCVPWKESISFAKSGQLSGLEAPGWMKGVQAMSILGMIFLFVGLLASAVNLVIKSKGDRLRLLYLFICVVCVVAAVFVLIGNFLLMANHSKALDQTVPHNTITDQIYSLFTKRFAYSWGFALDIVSVALTLLAGLAHFLGGRIANNVGGIV